MWFQVLKAEMKQDVEKEETGRGSGLHMSNGIGMEA